MSVDRYAAYCTVVARLVTGDRFRQCLAALDWSQRGLARLLDVDEREVRRWASGTNAIPERIAIWLDRLAGLNERNPLPMRNR